jgi:uncharacterized protein YkwD
MSDSDTAVLCLEEARAWSAARRVVTLVAMLVVSLSWVSVAGAHAHRRAHARVRTRIHARVRTRVGAHRCAAAHTTIAHASRARLQRAVVCLINHQRHAHGLPSLRENQRLNRSAQGWTNVMVTHRDFSHGADFAARISAVGFDWSNVGENIATGYTTPARVVAAWMASKGHCQNILNPQYRYVGTGVSERSITGYSTLAGTWTQDFGLLMGQHAPSGNWTAAEHCPYT